MSIKKLFGKVAVGAAVGALVVAGAVAGTDLWGTNAPGDGIKNGAVGKTNASLSIVKTVDLRAYLGVLPASVYYNSEIKEDGKFAIDKVKYITLDDSGSIVSRGEDSVAMGNVGRLWVETNARRWDVVAILKNGGILKRDLPDNEKEWGDSTPVYEPGYGGHLDFREPKILRWEKNNCTNCAPLMYTTGGTPSPSKVCSLGIGVGLLTRDEREGTRWGAPTSVVTVRQIALDSTLDFKVMTPGSPQRSASFAEHLGKKGNNMSGRTKTFPYNKELDSLSPFGDSTQWRTAQIDEKGFPKIKIGSKQRLSELIGGEADNNDDAVVFIINANIKNMIDEGGELRNNENGRYEETIEFQFYGMY